MTSTLQTDIYKSSDLTDLIRTLREEYDKLMKINHIRIKIKPTHSQLRNLRKALNLSDQFSLVDIKEDGKYNVINLVWKESTPYLVSYTNDELCYMILEEIKKFWAQKFISSKIKVINTEIIDWIEDCFAIESTPTGRKGPVHTEEWNRHISEARIGMRLKTKSREGIEWKWEGNKKVWIR